MVAWGSFQLYQILVTLTSLSMLLGLGICEHLAFMQDVKLENVSVKTSNLNIHFSFFLNSIWTVYTFSDRDLIFQFTAIDDK